ncbi:hypothetical protein BD779DRAFT_713531 [Infundibulicybe gibba]|nr:hypothetical protein BD779DRAFT_713531 [Infundibulicybe gibba]
MIRRKASRSLPVCSWQSNGKAHRQNLTRIRQLPQDIYGLILSWIPDNSDLFNLCLTSRAFLREAEKKLYRCTKLARDTLTPVLWADTILESPLKAQQLRSLTLTFDLAYLIIPDTLLSSLQLISRALRSLTNLKELILLGHPRVMMNPIFSWILDRCTFQLEEFHNELFPTSAIISFLSQQSQIQYWAQTGVYSYSTQKPCPFHFPRLTALVGDGTLVRCLTAAEHIERLSLQIHCDSQKTFDGISRFRSTLAVLDLERFPTSGITAVEMIHTLSRETPGLRLLILWDRSIMVVSSKYIVQAQSNPSYSVTARRFRIMHMQCRRCLGSKPLYCGQFLFPQTQIFLLPPSFLKNVLPSTALVSPGHLKPIFALIQKTGRGISRGLPSKMWKKASVHYSPGGNGK